MGEATRHQKVKQENDKAFLGRAENRRCCFCGQDATTVDHFPPRTIFRKREWPDGYRFPACAPCNSGKKKYEQALPLLLSLMSFQERDESQDEEFFSLVRHVRNNFPELLSGMTSYRAAQSKHHIRRRFGESGQAFSKRGWRVIDTGPLSQEIFDMLCVSLAQTGYFKHTGKVLSGVVTHTWVPIENFNKPEMEQVLALFPSPPDFKRNGNDISDQFCYRYVIPDSGDVYLAVVWFGPAPQGAFVVTSYTWDAFDRHQARIEAKPDHVTKTIVGPFRPGVPMPMP